MAKAPDPFKVLVAQPDGKAARAEKDLGKLKKRDKGSHARLVMIQKQLCKGKQLTDQKFKFLQTKHPEKIFELKVYDPAWRLFGVQDGDTYWLTHLELKQDNDTWVADQAKVAREIYHRHVSHAAKQQQTQEGEDDGNP